MISSSNPFRDELRVSLEPILVVSWIPILMGAWFFEADPLVLTAFGLEFLLIFFNRWKPLIAKWFTVIVYSGMVVWLDQKIPGCLVLVILSLGLAAALIGLKAAFITASGQTFLIFLITHFLALETPATANITLTAIWGLFGLMVIVYWPVYDLANWAKDYYSQTETKLNESITQKVTLQQTLLNLAHASQELKAANQRVTMALQIAQEAQTAKSAFVAKVSHEFRTPLNMIIGLVDLLVQSPELYGEKIPSAVLEDLQIIYRNSKHLTSLVNDVLDLSQSESGRMTLYKEQISLADVIKEAKEVVLSLIQKKGLCLELSIPNNLPDIYCDRTRIRQVILNLLSNAARFTERGSITVSAVHHSDYVVVSVADTGTGISLADSEHIFEPFCQGGERLWQDKGGSGLGLTICKQLVELHGGRIWLESELGVGSTFYFDLPTSQPVMPTVSPGRWIMEDWEWKEWSGRSSLPDLSSIPYIVLCDETNELNSAFARSPEKVELVYTCDFAKGITDHQRPVNVVVLTTNNPGNLWPMADKARQAFINTPIVGCAMPDKLQRANEARVADYLIKPITLEKLYSATSKIGKGLNQVLVAEDDPEASMLMVRLLQSLYKNLIVVTSSSGEETLRLLNTGSFDLLILDIFLPDMEGWEVLEHKEQNSAIRDIPVIIASAQDPAEKPVRSHALLLTIDEGIPLHRILSLSLKISNLMSQPY
jgi:signal transduction histidine kinase/CheY-like chemotaxis protein